MAVTGEPTDSTKLFCENKIEEKDNGSDSISIGENRGNVYGCYFMSFIRKREWFRRKEAEIVRNYDRKALAAGKRCISMGEKDKSAGYGT